MRNGSVLLFTLAILAAPVVAQETGTDPTIVTGRELTALFFSGKEHAKLWEWFDDAMKQVIGSAENLPNFRAQVAQQLGTEKEVTEETITDIQGFRVYLRTSTYSTFQGRVLTQWAINTEGKVGGFFIRPKP